MQPPVSATTVNVPIFELWYPCTCSCSAMAKVHNMLPTGVFSTVATVIFKVEYNSNINTFTHSDLDEEQLL